MRCEGALVCVVSPSLCVCVFPWLPSGRPLFGAVCGLRHCPFELCGLAVSASVPHGETKSFGTGEAGERQRKKPLLFRLALPLPLACARGPFLRGLYPVPRAAFRVRRGSLLSFHLRFSPAPAFRTSGDRGTTSTHTHTTSRHHTRRRRAFLPLESEGPWGLCCAGCAGAGQQTTLTVAFLLLSPRLSRFLSMLLHRASRACLCCPWRHAHRLLPLPRVHPARLCRTEVSHS
jgi:hypothetical protein